MNENKQLHLALNAIGVGESKLPNHVEINQAVGRLQTLEIRLQDLISSIEDGTLPTTGNIREEEPRNVSLAYVLGSSADEIHNAIDRNLELINKVERLLF